MTQEELIAALKELNSEHFKDVFGALRERFGDNTIATLLAMTNGEALNPFEAGLIRASEMPETSILNPHWFGMYLGRVTMFIGETGAGKSSFLLNVAVHAARGELLWDFGFPGPVNVLYVDPENAGNYRDGERDGGLCGMKLKRIGKGKPENLHFHDGRGIDLSKMAHMAALEELICDNKYRVVTLDPIANLFNTQDENSNAEAARQGKALTELSRKTGACIIAAHHTGKDTTGNYGRGASARLAACDVGIVFRARGGSEDFDDTFKGRTLQREDICRVQIVKDRPNWFGKSSLYLRMEGDDKFGMATFEEWKNATQGKRSDKGAQAREDLLLLLQDGNERNLTEIQETMKGEGYGRPTVDDALAALVEQEKIRERRGDKNARLFQLPQDDAEWEEIA